MFHFTACRNTESHDPPTRCQSRIGLTPLPREERARSGAQEQSCESGILRGASLLLVLHNVSFSTRNCLLTLQGYNKAFQVNGDHCGFYEDQLSAMKRPC